MRILNTQGGGGGGGGGAKMTLIQLHKISCKFQNIVQLMVQLSKYGATFRNIPCNL